VGDLNPEQVHEPLHGKMECANLLRMQTDLALFGGAERALGLKGDIAVAVELALYLYFAILYADGDVFQRRIRARKNLCIENGCQSQWRDGDLSIRNLER